MSSLPQVTFYSDKAILGFGHAGNPFSRYYNFGPPQRLLSSTIPNSLRCLKILLGRELNRTDHQVLIISIEHTIRRCKALESVSIVANAHSWAGRASPVRRWKALPFVQYKEHIIDLDQNSGIVIRSYKHSLQRKRTSKLHILIPVDHVDEVTEVVTHWQIPPVAKLSLLPAMSLLWSGSPLSVGLNLAQLLQLLLDLCGISLPLELSSSLDYLLAFASLHHILCAVELSVASVMPFPHPSLTNLIVGLHLNDHLQKLAFPAYILCDDLCVCLGELQGLQFDEYGRQGQVLLIHCLTCANVLPHEKNPRFLNPPAK